MNSRDKQFSRLQWTQEEEDNLRKLREAKKLDSWETIAKLLNDLYPTKLRTGKQCRERYMNFVRFGYQKAKMTTWAQQQDELLFQKFVELGPKWVCIRNFIPSKSENCLKNRFYGIIRKIIRKIQRKRKQKNIRLKKQLKPDLFINILIFNYKPYIFRKWDETCEQLLMKLRVNVIGHGMACEWELEQPTPTSQLVEQILQFNRLLKRCKVKKPKTVSTYNERQQEKEESNNIMQSNNENEQQGSNESRNETQKQIVENLQQNHQNEEQLKVKVEQKQSEKKINYIIKKQEPVEGLQLIQPQLNYTYSQNMPAIAVPSTFNQERVYYPYFLIHPFYPNFYF